MKLSIQVTGVRALMQHNGRLANPLDPYTRRLAAITGKRKKTDEDLISIMMIEARGSCWETEEGLLGVPAAALWRSIYDAAKAYKRGEDIKRALLFDDITAPLLINGQHVTCDDWLKESAHIDYRPVKIMGRKTNRARPIIPAGAWQFVCHFDLLDDVINDRDLGPILERAGRLCGLGEWRPVYGTYQAEIM